MKFKAKLHSGAIVSVEQSAGAVIASAGLITPIPDTLEDGLAGTLAPRKILDLTTTRKLNQCIRMARYAITLPSGAWPETEQAMREIVDNLPVGMEMDTLFALARL